MKCGGDCTALTDGGEPVMQILVLDLKKWIEAAEKLGAEAGQFKSDYKVIHFFFSII